MPPSFNRRTATRVKDGRVQKKNRHALTSLQQCVIDRESPGLGYRHAVTKSDVQAFIGIVPEWQRYSARLRRIILARRTPGADAVYRFYHREETGEIYLHAWEEDFWVEWNDGYVDAHEDVFSAIGVSRERSDDFVICRFTEAQARAFMLLHIFMHELGHHYDRTTQKHLGASRGEDYAEHFANSRFRQLFPAYVQVFGDPNFSG